MNCEHCNAVLVRKKIPTVIPQIGNTCGDITHGHKTLCCDCFDLSCGMPLTQINEERAARGEAPITKEWK